MSDPETPNSATALKKLSLPDVSAEEFGQRGITDRVVHLVAPLTTGESKLIVNGRLVHDGTLALGMLRLCNPADHERRQIKKPLKVMVLTLPFRRFEGICAEHECPVTPASNRLSECHVIRHRLVEQLIATALLADDLIS